MDATSYSLDYYQWHPLKFMTLPSSQKYTCPTPPTQDWQGVLTYDLKIVQDTNTPITWTLLGLSLYASVNSFPNSGSFPYPHSRTP